MQISSLASTSPLAGPGLFQTVKHGEDISSSLGPLTRGDLAMLKAVSGEDFTWPPKEGEGAPRAAFDIAALRQRENIANSPLGELTTADIQALKRSGILLADFADKAIDYLSGKQTSGTDPRTTANTTDEPGVVYL